MFFLRKLPFFSKNSLFFTKNYKNFKKKIILFQKANLSHNNGTQKRCFFLIYSPKKANLDKNKNRLKIESRKNAIISHKLKYQKRLKYMINNSVKYFLSFLVVSQCAFGIDANIQSYKDRGVKYTPHYIGKGFTKYCKASWYGKGFHRSLTASGERYNMYDMTAAHRTFAMNTKIRITNLSNNKSVVVRVNDRGPFYTSRDIDLSYGAATRIGMVNSGVGKIKMEVVSSGKGRDERIAKTEVKEQTFKIAKASNEKRNHYVQVASFGAKKYAQMYKKENERKDAKLLVKAYPSNVNKNPVYRVVAEFDNLLKAKEYARREQNKGSFLTNIS